MPRLFNPPVQLGIVVRDLQPVLKHWVEDLGVGPWFIMESLPLQRYAHRGKAYAPPQVTIALAQHGELQIELIQPRDTTPSAWAEYLAAGTDGINHWCSYEPDYDGVLQRAIACGMEVVMEGDMARGKFAYLSYPATPNLHIEIAQPHPDRLRMYELIRQAARDWDGADPIRIGTPALNPAR